MQGNKQLCSLNQLGILSYVSMINQPVTVSSNTCSLIYVQEVDITISKNQLGAANIIAIPCIIIIYGVMILYYSVIQKDTSNKPGL